MIFIRRFYRTPYVFLLSFVLIAVVAWLLLHKQKTKTASTPPVVTVVTVRDEIYQPSLDAIGILQANQGAVLKAQTDGQVSQIHFKSGDNVLAGDILLELNNHQQRAALEAAIAEEKFNQLTYQRDLELKKLGAIALASVDQAKASVDAGAAAVQEAEAAYDLTITKAPFSGRVGVSKVNVGDYVQAGDPIVSLQNLDPMFVDFSVPQQYFSAIKIGGPVVVKAETTKQVVQGKIMTYETIIDQTTGTLMVRALAPNPQGKLLPGGYVTLSIALGDASKTLTVPQMAILYEAKGNYVYLVKDNMAIKHSVRLGEQVQQNIQILEGLQAGDMVVSAGTNKVHDHDFVHPVMENGKENL